MPHRLLFIESPSFSASGASCSQAMEGFACERMRWDHELRDRLHMNSVDLIIVAISDSEEAGSFMAGLRHTPLTTPLFAIMPTDCSDELLNLVSQIADDFMLVPIRPAELRQRILRIIGDNPPVKIDEHLIRELTLSGMVGHSPGFLQIVSKIPLMARSNGPVLITGETGTGKELCARAIHNFGARRDRAFIAVDCASLPEQLFESELFGHVRGAFTDARSDRQGLVGLAHRGTLFLDEIDVLSLTSQSKLLRLLQERSYRPLGYDGLVDVDVTIVAATNGDLRRLVQAGRFRADLFFRLNVLRLNLVPLRQRREDIVELAHHFVTQVCLEHGIAAKSLPPATVRKLNQYHWPGNVRELLNVVRRAVLLCEGTTILPSHIIDTEGEQIQVEAERESFREARSRAIESFERGYVEQVMHESKGNVSRAAQLAGKERRAFGRLVKRYGIKQYVAR
jgi:two-component system, NtrC family, response regulator GlrR